MKQKTQRAMAAVAAIFSLVFQSAAPAVIFASEMISSDSAEAATPTPEVTPTDIPSPTPEATPETTPAAEITPTPTFEPEATPTATPMPVPTPTPVWTAADDGRATTSSLVILGQRYQALQNGGVSVTFSRLPESPGYLSIKEVNLTEEERAGIGAISTTAYEITSTMENGAFTYNLTLPYVDDNNDGVIGPDNTSIDSIGVAVSEDGSEYAPVEQAVTQKDQKLVEISGLDHFTVFILVKNLPNDNGGTATQDDFPVYIDDEEVDWGENQVDAGSYTVSEDTLAGYTASEWGTDCNADGEVTLAPGETKTCTITNDDEPGEIHGAKFENENGNGEWDQGEEGLSGWTIYADINGDGEFNDGEPSDETGDDGQYFLTDLAAGTYQVREIVKDGWTQTTANPDPIEVGNGEIIEGINFGNFELFTISGKKFNDLNGDGVRTNGDSDPNLAGWTIQLDLVDNDSTPTCDTGSINGEFCELVTDEFGNYSFENLGLGEYRVAEVLQAGWTQTAPTSETGLGGQDDGTYLVSGSSGVNRAGRNFGNFELGRIKGVKFNDANGNGVRDEGELGLEGWTIYLDVNENGQLDDGEPSTTTDADGGYEFSGLSAGTYRVREVLQDEWTQTMPEGEEYVEEVASGSVFEGRDFGNFEDVTIIVYKWEDWDGDGEWDEGEPFIGDWPMTDSIVTTRTSSGTDGVPFQTEIIELQLSSVTASDSGQVNFKVSKPGTHRIEEGSKDNFQRTYPVDSFFDIFVELGGDNITHDKDGNQLWFGNIFFEEVFGGMFAPTSGDADSTPGATILGDTTITLPEDGGVNTISFLDKTVVTRSDGENLDISDLSGSSPALGSLTGLGSGVVADGALQWGLTDLGLEFSQPITVNIFVGTSFNGQTLNVVRSTSGTGGWANDGIVAPATCTVVDGFCTFQATKASFYAATHTTSTGTTSSSSMSSDGGGGGGTTVCSDAKPASPPQLARAAAGSNTVTLTWSEAGDPVTYYLVAYGTTSGTLTYGNPNIGGKGTTSYTVGSLSGGTTYYFRVRAGNGCTPGDYSNEIAATPGGEFVAGPAAGFAEGVLGVETEITPETTVPSPVLTPFLTPKPTSGKVLGQESGKWNWWWLMLIIPGPAALLWWWSRR